MNLNRALIPFLLVVLTALMLRADDSKPASIDLNHLRRATPEEMKDFFNSTNYAGLRRTDSEFLNDVYRAVLQREPDPGGHKEWLASLSNSGGNPKARQKVVETFLQSAEYADRKRSEQAAAVIREKNKRSRNPGNVLFEQTGVLVNDATALPADRYASLFKKARITWLSLQIDNGGGVRTDNTAALERGWDKQWRTAGFKIGFWGAARGVTRHNDEKALAEAIPLVQADAALAVKLTAQYHGEFYLADCEDGYQSYGPTDPAPALNRVYVDAFQQAAEKNGIAKIPKALSSMGRIALDMQPWIDGGWDAMPQAYWNMYSHYRPSHCVDFYVKETGWPIERVHPTIATFTSEGEKRTVSLKEYAADLQARETKGFSFYLPESYLRFDNEAPYEELATMAGE